MAKEIFISYSRKDFDKVKAIKDEIDREVGIDCWMDLDGIESGEQFENVIIKAINEHDTMLFMFSPNSMESEYARDELDFAKHKNKRIVLVYVELCKMNDQFYFGYRKYDSIDWYNPLQHDKLIRDLRTWFPPSTQREESIGETKEEKPVEVQPKVKVPEPKEVKSPKKLRKSLYVGLGGIGVQTVLQTKATYMNHFGKDGELPPMLEFMAVDVLEYESIRSLTLSNGEMVSFAPTEYSDVSIPNAAEYFQRIQKKSQWMPPLNVGLIKSINQGACMLRSNGRLAFLCHRELLKNQIRSAFARILSTSIYSEEWQDYCAPIEGLGNGHIEVNIVSSLCGGAGSGMLIDMAYLIHEVAQEQNQSVVINAYCVLPDVFEQVVGGIGTILPRLYANTYATLRELDFLMSKHIERQYVKLPITREMDVILFQSVFVFGNIDESGTKKVGVGELTHTISSALVAAGGKIGESDLSVGDNIYHQIMNRVFEVNNKCSWITPVGISTIGFNLSALDKKYKLQAQNACISQLLSNPIRIISEWIQHIKPLKIPKMPFAEIDKTQLHSDHMQEEVFGIVEKEFKQHILSSEKMEQKLAALCDDAKMELIIHGGFDFISHLGDIMSFLGSIQQQLTEEKIIPQYKQKEELQAKEEQARLHLLDYIEQLESYKKKFFRSKATEFAKTNEVVNGIYNYLEAKQEAYYAEWTAKYYDLLAQFVQSEIQRFQHKINLFTEIQLQNSKKIEDIDYHYDELDINLTEQIEKITQWADFYAFDSFDFTNALPHGLYHEDDKQVYEEALNTCVENKRISSDKQLSIELLFQKQSKKEKMELLSHVNHVTKPLLQINNHGYTHTHQGQFIGQQGITYVCVPDAHTSAITPVIYDALRGSNNYEIISTGLDDRIIILKCKSPIPVFAIQSLDKYKTAYQDEEEHLSPYIDEWWQREMEIEGFSLWPQEDVSLEALKAWVMGCILGMIKFENGTYWYQETTTPSVAVEVAWVDTHEPSRVRAFDAFSSHGTLYSDYTDIFHRHLMELGMSAAHQLEEDVMENYMTKYSRYQVKMTALNLESADIETKEMLLDEERCIQEIFS